MSANVESVELVELVEFAELVEFVEFVGRGDREDAALIRYDRVRFRHETAHGAA